MKKNKKLLLSLIFFVIMLIATGLILFKDNDLSNVIDAAKQINIKYLLICLLLIIMYLLFEALYILITLKSLKAKTTLAKSFAYSCIEYYFSAITPSSTGGQPFQSYYMAKDGIPVTKSSIALLLNTYTFKIILLLLGVFCILFKPTLVFGNGLLFNILFVLGFLINAFIIVGCLLVLKSKRKVKKFAIKIINLMAKLHIKKNPEETIEKMDSYIEEYRAGALYLKKHPALTFKVLALTFAQRLCMFSIGFIVYLAFDLNTYSYLDFLTIQVIVAIAIDSLPFPGGMGISEAILLKIYTPIYSSGLLTASVLITRLCSYYFCLILSGIVSLINHLITTFKTKQKITEERK